MNTKLLTLLCAAIPGTGLAQISYTGGVYTQDFNTLESSSIYTYYTNLPPSWVVRANFVPSAYVWTTVTNGYSDNYGIYCFSSAPGAPDKSIGLVIGSTGPAYLGTRFRNATGITLTSFALSYFTEQWSKGEVISNDQAIPFSYSIDATNLTSETFANVAALDLHSINDGDGVAAAMNGNVASNRQWISSTVSGISWPPDKDLWIRWAGVSYPFVRSHALAIDDFSFQAIPELRISGDGPGQCRVSWSTNWNGCVLQSALTPTAKDWDTMTNVPVVLGTDFAVGLETVGAQRFFRLIVQ